MKNLKLFVFALCLLTMSLVTVFAAADTPESCKNNNNVYYLDHGNNTYTCSNEFTSLVRSINENETAEIVLLKDHVFGSPVTIDKDVTLNLNGHKLKPAAYTATGAIVVKGANVTIKNGTLDLVAGVGQLAVDSSEKASTLTVANDVTVNATLDSVSAVKINDASNKTTVNVNGKWTVKNEIVACTNDTEGNLTVNLNAEVKATALTQVNYLVAVDAGTSTVNVNGGTYESNRSVFMVKNGTLNIKGGSLTAKGGNAIVVEQPGTNYKTILNISGGVVTTKAEDKYAVYFGSGTGTEEADYSITGGTFTSGKKDKKQLPALFIGSQTFLENHPAIISKGVFTGAIVGDVETDATTKTYTRAAAAAKILVGNATVSEKDGVVTVGGTHTDTETGKKPEEQAPNTFDAGLTYVGLALSAIGASVVSVRKLKNN